MKTEKISTYLYAFVVGPYEEISYEGPNKNNYVPLKLYAWKSFMKYIKGENAKIFFELTTAGMDYYAEFFGIKYPFWKYD